jgi:PIN domain nuclease of toxin-antitoxin system
MLTTTMKPNSFEEGGFELQDSFKRSKQELNLIEIPITGKKHELRFTRFDCRDPRDRYLAATSKAYDLTLVAADERLMRVSGIQMLANR